MEAWKTIETIHGFYVLQRLEQKKEFTPTKTALRIFEEEHSLLTRALGTAISRLEFKASITYDSPALPKKKTFSANPLSIVLEPQRYLGNLFTPACDYYKAYAKNNITEETYILNTLVIHSLVHELSFRRDVIWEFIQTIEQAIQWLDTIHQQSRNSLSNG